MPKSLDAKISSVIQARDAIIAEIDAQIFELEAKKAELLAGRDGQPRAKRRKGRRPVVDEEELSRLLKAGWTGKSLAAHFGVSHGTIRNHKTKLGLTQPRKKKATKKKERRKAKKKTGRKTRS